MMRLVEVILPALGRRLYSLAAGRALFRAGPIPSAGLVVRALRVPITSSVLVMAALIAG